MNVDLKYRNLPCFYSDELNQIIGYSGEIDFLLKILMFVDEKILKLEEPPIKFGYSEEHKNFETMLKLIQ